LAGAAQAPAYPVTAILLTSRPEPLCRGDSFTVLVNIIQPETFTIPVVAVTASHGLVNPASPLPEGCLLFKFDYTAQHRTLEGQTHQVVVDVLAPVLVEFFNSNEVVR
jgi:hypothetical protein